MAMSSSFGGICRVGFAHHLHVCDVFDFLNGQAFAMIMVGEAHPTFI
jgi:hypothetical protein